MKTRKLISVLFVTLMTAVTTVNAQSVGIGDKEFTPDKSAILEVQSSNKGLLIPRMTYSQRLYIQVSPQAQGLLVYQTDREVGFYYYDGTQWLKVSTYVSDGTTPQEPIDLGSLAKVSLSGDYKDLIGTPELKAVATTGSFNDLTDKPSIPARLQDLQQDENYYTTVSRAERERWNEKANVSDIPSKLSDLQQDQNYAMYVTRAEKEMWNEAVTKQAFSGDYAELKNKPTLSTVAISGSYDDLKNKPNFDITLDGENVTLSTVALTGKFADLTEKPNIPSKLSDLATDENTMTVSRMEKEKWNTANAFTGYYEDLRNKPVIPTKLQDLQQDENYYTTVSRAERERWNEKANKSDIPTRLDQLVEDPNYSMFVTREEKEKWNAKSNFSGKYADLTDKPDFNVDLGGGTVSLATVALTGKYEDLQGKPTLQSVATSGSYKDLVDKPEFNINLDGEDVELSTVALTGKYEDLIGKPDVSSFSGTWDSLKGKPAFADVALTGSFEDLKDKPNFNITIEGGDTTYSFATVAFTGKYTDLSGAPALSTIATSGSYNDLTDKPNFNVSVDGKDVTLSTVAITGKFADLVDKPAIPTRLQDLEEDPNYYMTVSRAEKEKWNTSSAFSGSYDDLRNKPFIPARLQDLQQDENYYTTVSRAERERWNEKANVSDIPTKLQELQQDENYAMYVTRAEKDRWNGVVGEDGKLNVDYDMVLGETKKLIPTHLSQLLSDDNAQTVTKEDKSRWNSQSDWEASKENADGTINYAFIKNKPDVNEVRILRDGKTTGGVGFNALTEEKIELDLPEVAFTGSYNDIKDKPEIPVQVQPNWKAEMTDERGNINYSFIQNKPTIGNGVFHVYRNGKGAGVADGAVKFTANYSEEEEVQLNLSEVAFTGSYNDLKEVPVFPTHLEQFERSENAEKVTLSDKVLWNTTSANLESYKTSLEGHLEGHFDRKFANLSDLPEFRGDWNETDAEKYSYIRNKPQNLSQIAINDLVFPQTLRIKSGGTVPIFDESFTVGNQSSENTTITLSDVSFTGSYDDLKDKPVFTDGGKTVYDGTLTIRDKDDDYGVSFSSNNRENKTLILPTIAFTGKYADLSGTPRTITAEEIAKLNDIEYGANVNVPSDWNATPTQDGFILNKPNVVIQKKYSVDSSLIDTRFLEIDKHLSLEKENESYKNDIKTRILTIEEGAQVNVMPDWNAKKTSEDGSTETYGSGYIKNKPEFYSPNISSADVLATEIKNYNTNPDATNHNVRENDIISSKQLVDILKAVEDIFVPIGTVVMWTGTEKSIPCGWVHFSEMDGRSPVGVGDGSYKFKTHSSSGDVPNLTYAHVGRFSGDPFPSMRGLFSQTGDSRGTSGNNTLDGVSYSSGIRMQIGYYDPEGKTFDNRTPYYSVYFIAKTHSCLSKQNIEISKINKWADDRNGTQIDETKGYGSDMKGRGTFRTVESYVGNENE